MNKKTEKNKTGTLCGTQRTCFMIGYNDSRFDNGQWDYSIISGSVYLKVMDGNVYAKRMTHIFFTDHLGGGAILISGIPREQQGFV